MKFLVLIFLLLSNVTCDSAPKDTNEIETDNTTDIQQDVPKQGASNPGEIIFSIKVLDSYNASKDICGLTKTNVFLVEVVEIKEGGMGITHMPRKTQQILVNFILPANDLEKNTLIEANAKESLCPDTSKSYFTVKNYKFLE